MKRARVGADRALFWTFAVAAFAMAAAGLAARAVDRLATAYDDDREGYAIVRVLAPEGAGGITAAQIALAHAPHVTSAAPMTERRAAALLERWGGAPVRAGDMPALRLIEVDLEPAAPDADLSGDIQAALAQGGVTAEIIRPPPGVSGGGLAGTARIASYWAAALFAGVMALIVSLAARSLAARRQDLLTVMADLGATSGQAAGRVADEAGGSGLRAGLIGALAAAVVGLVLVLMLVPGAAPETLGNLILPIDLAPLVAAPLLIAVAAGMGARAGAESVHAHAARLA